MKNIIFTMVLLTGVVAQASILDGFFEIFDNNCSGSHYIKQSSPTLDLLANKTYEGILNGNPQQKCYVHIHSETRNTCMGERKPSPIYVYGVTTSTSPISESGALSVSAEAISAGAFISRELSGSDSEKVKITNDSTRAVIVVDSQGRLVRVSSLKTAGTNVKWVCEIQ